MEPKLQPIFRVHLTGPAALWRAIVNQFVSVSATAEIKAAIITLMNQKPVSVANSVDCITTLLGAVSTLELNNQHFAEVALLEVFDKVLPSEFRDLKIEASRASPPWDTPTISNRFFAFALSLESSVEPDGKEVLFLASEPKSASIRNLSRSNSAHFAKFLSSGDDGCINCDFPDPIAQTLCGPVQAFMNTGLAMKLFSLRTGKQALEPGSKKVANHFVKVILHQTIFRKLIKIAINSKFSFRSS